MFNKWIYVIFNRFIIGVLLAIIGWILLLIILNKGSGVLKKSKSLFWFLLILVLCFIVIGHCLVMGLDILIYEPQSLLIILFLVLFIVVVVPKYIKSTEKHKKKNKK